MTGSILLVGRTTSGDNRPPLGHATAWNRGTVRRPHPVRTSGPLSGTKHPQELGSHKYRSRGVAWVRTLCDDDGENRKRAKSDRWQGVVHRPAKKRGAL